MKKEHAQSHDPLTLSEQALVAQRELYDTIHLLMDVANVSRVRDLVDAVDEAFTELASLKREEIEFGKKLGLQRPAVIRRKIEALSEIPDNWDMNDPATRLLVVEAMPMAVSGFMASLSSAEDPQEAYDKFIADKESNNAFGWLCIYLQSPLKQYKFAKESEEAASEASQVPPNARDGFEDMPDENFLDIFRMKTERLRTNWEETLERSDGDRELARKLMVGQSASGLDYELREAIGVVGEWWPSRSDYKFTAERLGVVISNPYF